MSRQAPLSIVPLDADLLGAAATLLAGRHQRDRTTTPALPAGPADPALAAVALEAALERPLASAAAALRDGQLLGYLAGDVQIDPFWGRVAWVRLAGAALAPGQGLECLGELYAALGADWVRRGIFGHFVIAPAADRAGLETWFRLGFGIEQVYGLADLAELAPEPVAAPEGLSIRRAGPADREHLAELSGLLWRHQTEAPVWAINLPERAAELQAAYADLAEDADATVWLAFDGEQALGFQAYFPANSAPDDLLTPADCVELSVAGTRPEARSRGVGLALTRHGLATARAEGARYCLTDWRSANLLAAHFWPRRGFQPIAYRLARRIDPRIAWACG